GGDVEGVRVPAVAEDLAPHARAAGDRPVPFLQHEEGAALPHHEAVAIGVERSRGAGRFVPAAAEGAHASEGGDGDRPDHGFGPLGRGRMARGAGVAFGISSGTRNGETRLGPFSNSRRSSAPWVVNPPMPVPTTTPHRLGSAPMSPASRSASTAAANPSWLT